LKIINNNNNIKRRGREVVFCKYEPKRGGALERNISARNKEGLLAQLVFVETLTSKGLNVEEIFGN
jgi:ribosomal protein L36